MGTIVLLISIFSSLGEDQEKEFNFIKPNDDAGFFIPYKKLPGSEVEKEGIPSKGWEEIKSEPQPQYQPEDKKEMEAYKPPEEYKSPKEEYNPPKEEYNPPKVEYNPPKEEYNPPKEEYKTPMELKEGKNLMNNDENIDIEK